MELLFNATATNWILILIASFIIGLSKAGLKGIDMMNVTIMAIVFGGKASTGIVLPLLCVADIMAVIIILTIAIVLVLEVRKTPAMPSNKLFSAVMGLISGFTTMLGNLAGAF